MVSTVVFLSLSETLRREVASQLPLRPDVMLHLASQSSDEFFASVTNLALVYLHVGDGTTTDAEHLLRLVDQQPVRPTVVAVVDGFESTEGVRLLQQGFDDCLPTPLDFGRIAMQIEYELWRARDLTQSGRERQKSSPKVERTGLVSATIATLMPFELESTRRNAELAAIHHALAAHKNNRSKAAAALGISRVTLYKKLHKYGMMEFAQDAG